MSVERLMAIKENLMCAVESQMYNLQEADAEELGEVVDMIKDIEEAIYYCAVVKAMEDSDYKEKDKSYYTPMYYGNHSSWKEKDNTDWRDERRYYDGNGSSGQGNGGYTTGGAGNGNSYYTEREYPHAFEDKREGKSYRSRRMYMEAKEAKQDKTVQMRELEKYMQELTQDIVEMVEGSSAEEKQYLSKKVSALATKLGQLND